MTLARDSIGNVSLLCMGTTTSGIASSTSVNVFNLPTGYRQGSVFDIGVYDSALARLGMLYTASDGSGMRYVGTAITTGTNLRIYGTYLITA